MARLIKWLRGAVFACWGVDLLAAYYFKSRAIDEMHDPLCCRYPVWFASLTDHPVLIYRGTALGYHLTQWIFFGCCGLMAVLYAGGRRFAQSARHAGNDL